MIFTGQQVAQNIDRAIEAFYVHAAEHGARQDQAMAGLMMAALILGAMGLKEPSEGVRPALDRLLKSEEMPYDFLNSDHRTAGALMLQQMLEPLGVNRIFVVGLTPELSVFITCIQRDTVGDLTIEQMRELFMKIAQDENAEWML